MNFKEREEFIVMVFPEKVAKIKLEHIMQHAQENGNVKWLKKHADEIQKTEPNSMKAFFKLRKEYLAEFCPELLAKKKTPKKGKSMFQKIAEMEG